MLRSLGVSEHAFSRDVDTFLYNDKIMEHVSTLLRKTNVELDLGPHRSLAGSLANIAKTLRSTEAPINMDRQYADSLTRVECAFALNTKLINASQACMYRIYREPVIVDGEEHHPWSCYSFQNYMNVPQAWRDNRNQLFNNGTVRLWNAARLGSQLMPYSNFIHHLLQKQIKGEVKQ